MLPGMFNPPPIRLPPLSTDFSEYPIGGQLKDFGWTEIGAAGGVLTDGTYEIMEDPDSRSGRSVRVSQGGVDQYRACLWDKIGVVTDVEILALIRLEELPNAIGGGGVCRVGTSSKSGYDAVFDSTSAGGFEHSYHVSQFTAGFFDGAIGGTVVGIDLDTVNSFWLRFRILGDTLGIKSWMQGTPEPASFAEGTDPTYTSGMVGLQTVERREFRCHFFGVALDGKTAQIPHGY